MKNRPWTPEENARLAALRQGMGSMKELSRLLPGRTTTACIVHATKIGLGARHHKQYAVRFSWVELLVSDAIQKNPGKTVREISEITKASYPSCHKEIMTGHGTKYHISGWVRYRANQRWTAKWSIGEGEDVPKPRRISSAESKRRCKTIQEIKAQANNPFAVAMNQVVMREAA